MKQCKRCTQTMVLTDFSVDNTKGDRRNIYCKQCVRAYHHSHKGPISDNKKNYYELHKEDIKQKRKEYRKFNPEKIKLTQKKYYEAHKVELNESSSEYRKDWREKNKLKIREQARLYYQKHKERIYEYRRKRVKTDIQTRLAQRLRCRLRIARKNNQKKGSAIRDLGCSLADMMVYIEKSFYNHKQSRRKASVKTPEGMTEKEHSKKDGLITIWDCGKIKLRYM